MRARYTYEVPAPIDDVVRAFMTTEFFISTMKHAGAVSIDLLEERPLQEGGCFWRARISESSRVPELLRASDLDSYINESRFDPTQRRLTWRITPNFSAGRLSLTGEILLFENGETTRVDYLTELTLRIPLIGEQVEAFFIKLMGDELKKQRDFLCSWLDGRSPRQDGPLTGSGHRTDVRPNNPVFP